MRVCKGGKEWRKTTGIHMRKAIIGSPFEQFEIQRIIPLE